MLHSSHFTASITALSPPPFLTQGMFSGQSKRKEFTDVYFFFFPLSHIDSFEVGACMESLDLYF